MYQTIAVPHGYGRQHTGLGRRRGSAKDHPCEYPGCEVPAATWAYLGAAPDELIDPTRGKFGLAYSPTDDSYVPTCRVHNDDVDAGKAERDKSRAILRHVVGVFGPLSFLEHVPMEDQLDLSLVENRRKA